MAYKKTTLIILFFIAIAISVAGCCEFTDKESVSSKQSSSGSHDRQIQILNHSFERSKSDFSYVTGTAKNVCDETLSYANLEVKFYDKNGVLLAITVANITDLDPGEFWKFRIRCWDDENVDSYKIVVGRVG